MRKIKNILNCNHSNLIKSMGLVQIKNKYMEIETETCKRCGEIFTSSKETEKIRNMANPTLLNRIKEKLKPKINMNLLRGRVL